MSNMITSYNIIKNANWTVYLGGRNYTTTTYCVNLIAFRKMFRYIWRGPPLPVQKLLLYFTVQGSPQKFLV